MIYVYTYAGIGLLVAIWFALHMRRWARVGNRNGRSTGSLRLIIMVPFAAILWPFTAWLLLPSTPSSRDRTLIMRDLVKIEDDEIVIRVPISAIKDAAAYAFDDAWGFQPHNVEVVDEQKFAKEIVTEMRRETETGITLVHRMLDKACVTAAENGAFGLNEA